MASKKVVKQYVQRLRKDYILKSRLLFFMYAYFIVDRTLLSRPFGWSNGMQNIMGGWGLLDPETGQVTLEAVENFLFFVPYLFLFFLAFRHTKSVVCIIRRGIAIGFLTSICIEMLQMIFKVGEFQISDLVYNTLGALLGSVLFVVVNFILELYNCEKNKK